MHHFPSKEFKITLYTILKYDVCSPGYICVFQGTNLEKVIAEAVESFRYIDGNNEDECKIVIQHLNQKRDCHEVDGISGFGFLFREIQI